MTFGEEIPALACPASCLSLVEAGGQGKARQARPRICAEAEKATAKQASRSSAAVVDPCSADVLFAMRSENEGIV